MTLNWVFSYTKKPTLSFVSLMRLEEKTKRYLHLQLKKCCGCCGRAAEVACSSLLSFRGPSRPDWVGGWVCGWVVRWQDTADHLSCPVGNAAAEWRGANRWQEGEGTVVGRLSRNSPIWVFTKLWGAGADREVDRQVDGDHTGGQWDQCLSHRVKNHRIEIWNTAEWNPRDGYMLM